MITSAAIPSTRQRLISAGLRLFAERGFAATTVGQIEQEAGLKPRRGAMYRHFASKEALLEAAVRQHIESVGKVRTQILDLPAGDRRTEAELLGRHVFEELEAQRQVVDVLEHERARLPELRAMFREQISDVSYEVMAEVLRRWLGDARAAVEGHNDLEAVAVLLLGALINVHRSAWTFGGPPAGIDTARAISAWAQACLDTLDALQRRTGAAEA